MDDIYILYCCILYHYMYQQSMSINQYVIVSYMFRKSKAKAPMTV